MKQPFASSARFQGGVDPEAGAAKSPGQACPRSPGPRQRRAPARGPLHSIENAASDRDGSPISLDGLNLLSHDSQSRQIASDLVQSVWRQGRSLWRDQRIELPGGFAEAGVEVPDSQPEPLGLHAVDDSSAFAHQALALAARPLGVLFLGHGDRPCCSVRTRRAASPETLSLAWPCRDGRSSNGDAYATPPRSSDGSRCLHTPSAQPTSQPKAYGADGSRA